MKRLRSISTPARRRKGKPAQNSGFEPPAPNHRARPLQVPARLRKPARKPRTRQPPTRAQLLASIRDLKAALELEREQLQLEESSLVQAQQELEVSCERYADLYDHAPIGYLSMDRNGLLVDANLTAAKMLRRERSRLIGHTFIHHVSAEDRRRLTEHLSRVRRQSAGVAMAADVRLRADADTTLTVQLICVRGGEATGDRKEIRVAMIDVTEQRRAEEQLCISEQRFRTMANGAPVLIWICDANRDGMWFNQPWLEFVGRKLEQELGSGWLDNIHPGDRERCAQTHGQAFAARREFRIEYRLRRCDGAWRWVLDHGVPLYGLSDTFAGYVGSCMDIQEQKQVEKILRAKQAELQLVADNTPVMLARCGRDLRYKFVNRAYAESMGQAPEQIVGRCIREVLGENAYQSILPHMEKVLTGQPVEYETEIRYPVGGLRCVHVAYRPDVNENGEVVGWVAAITDITEHKLAERRLQLRNTINRTLAEATALPEAAVKIIEELCESTAWEVGAVWLVSQTDRELWCLNFWHLPAAPVPEFEADTRRRRLAIGQGVPGQVWSTGELLFIADLAEANQFLRIASARKDGLQSGVCLPIKLGKKVLGMIELFSRRQQEPDQGFLNMLTAIGDKLGHFIERKLAEAALRLSEERMHHILETALDAVITIESDGVITGWNPQAEQIFGWTKAEAVGRKLIATIIPTQYRDDYERGLQHYLETGERPMLDKRIELKALHRSGREFPAEMAITPLVLEDRVSFGTFVRDITERKAAEESLRRHVEEMAAANEDMERFNRVAVGRELRMIELKKEINELRARAGLPPQYDLEFASELTGDAPPPVTNGELKHPAKP